MSTRAAIDWKGKILRRAERVGVTRPRDLGDVPNARSALRRLASRGDLLRVAHGVYIHPEGDYSAHHSLTEVAARIPSGVICLISALTFHELTLVLPWEVWVAVSHKGRILPGNPAVRIVRMTGNSFDSGVETHTIDGVPVRIYSAAKTVADCFKFRHKIGLGIAIEALRMGWEAGSFTREDLEREARACRVAQVMAPYVEML